MNITGLAKNAFAFLGLSVSTTQFANAQPTETGMSAREWIVKNTAHPLDVVDLGPFETSQGQLAFLDPLAFFQGLENTLVAVPASGGRLVVFHSPQEARNSKLAVIFSDEAVSSGADVATIAVDAGMASVFTPKTHAATTVFYDSLSDDPYNSFFSKYDDPSGGERKIVPLPDGTPVPYIHSGWGDGGYPVFTLNNTSGEIVAIYADFMGHNDDGHWLLPPGVTQ